MSDVDFDDATTFHRAKPAEVKPAGFRVVVTSGPDAGASIVIDDTRVSRLLVGQSRACDLVLSDREVSRRHLALDLLGDRVQLVDLGSSNGTSVQGVEVIEARLRGGEHVRIGGTTLAIERLTTAAASPLTVATRFGRVLGASPEMRRLYSACTRLAASNAPLLIEGETGTGKELLAEAIHESGPRANGPFVVFDCTAVPSSLVEAALFGHEKGSFTGATEARKGVFEQAHGGTLLIDEIGDLALPLQAKLLRALEKLEVKRVGGDKFIKVDVRVISATRRDLDKEVAAGRFRDDLFYRLAVTRIELPPLRRRTGDVALLAEHFWASLGGQGPLPSDLLHNGYEWPGNIRELHNTIARRIALGESSPLEDTREEADLDEGDMIDPRAAFDLPLPRARQAIVEAFERRYVAHVLGKHGGHVARAAAASGIARRNFQVLRAKLRR
jgi:two-component system, NtrC family, response regulator HydG